MSPRSLTLTIGTESFDGRLEIETAPHSCQRLLELLPYRGSLIHARWSGESLWSPLGSAWQGGILPEENATERPQPGDMLLYAGEMSEPELLMVYGPTRFACRAGALAGNRVLRIEGGLDRLAALGRRALWHGALRLHID